ncbi:MAG: type II toxin-antitoxin system VapC family toxin [Planctomycetes bacterium]|nr:type II toxin-antitoxin system VapC family toxin [Planctomycetota bacterium]
MDAALLDTDTLNEVLKQRNPLVVQKSADYLRQHGQFAISAMTRYELLRGLKEKQATKQLTQFQEFCRHSLILPITDAILDRTADLWVAARRGGFPGKDADLLIAATALETQRVLVTGNTAHFAWVPSLKIENWRMA